MKRMAIVLLSSTLLVLATAHAETDAAPERLFWDKVPLQITLPVGTERLVTFPDNVRLGLPAALTSKLRSQSHQGTVYWLAHEPFEATRIQVQGINSDQVYLVDLRATKNKTPHNPIEILIKDHSEPENQPATAKSSRPTSPDYVQLTRFAAQQLYAPARLLKTPRGVHRSSVNQQPITHLIRGQKIEATPIAAWRQGRWYVTAIQLKNQSDHPIELDPRVIRGRWLTATFQHARIHASGSELDTTALYLISNRPYQEAL